MSSARSVAPMREAQSAWPSCPSAFRWKSRARCCSGRSRSAAGGLRIDGGLHRPVERVALLAGRGVARAAGPVGAGGDDETALRIDEDALAEDAARHEAAVVEGPPLVAVAAPRDADVGLARRGLGEPAVGHDGLVAHPRSLQD